MESSILLDTRKPKSSEVCTICKRVLHLTAAGIIYKHEPDYAGSGKPPAVHTTVVLDTDGTTNTGFSEVTSADILRQLRDSMK